MELLEFNIDDIKVKLASKVKGVLFDCEDHLEFGEERYQLVEGNFYQYELPEGYQLDDRHELVETNAFHTNQGRITPNIYVGQVSIPVLDAEETKVAELKLEVRSIKANYRSDYRFMLETITEKCTDLLLQSNSPVTQHFDIDYEKDSSSTYQRFSFIKSVIDNEEFDEAIQRILTSPVTKWIEKTEVVNTQRIKRLGSFEIRQLTTGSQRTSLPSSHHLHSVGLTSIPNKISSYSKTDSVDTPENRFVKHALETYLKFCSDIQSKASVGSRLYLEAKAVTQKLESYLHNTIFKGISRPTSLKLNSPILQRKEGYRELLKSWLVFDLAAKLTWQGGDDVYRAGKRDVATLYEYWLFFTLLDLFKDAFEIEPKETSKLIQKTNDGLGLQLKQGQHTALKGVFNTSTRELNVSFNYNKSFSGKSEYPEGGSWTKSMRPDYTLSFWPKSITKVEEAERLEQVVHIHFDAKYKVLHLNQIIDEEEETSRSFKNADILKMHAYKDAIRRTGGAYVLYPGTESMKEKGFHEIIPGLGAFPVRPSRTNTGIADLKAFILEVINHFVNRASQREFLSNKVYDIYRDKPSELNEPIPEKYGDKNIIPDETFVLVGFYRSAEHYNWIKKGQYNFRMGSGNGSLILEQEVIGAKYLLLHTHKEKKSGDLWKIVSKGPKVYSRLNLEKKGYPKATDEKDYEKHYLVIEIEKVTDKEFVGREWDYTKLSNYSEGNAKAYPFTTTLTELMKVIMKPTQ
ncbi:hypothetical protein SAMN04488028_105290 [Reichenbachiella agariperforans]|uniref:DUF2357 domain-containing protein n=1 Tax=Reichenbachiella agariperforans TaxID=156994 RepID=A0A1M6T556_REIAG|nr:DUF2357 domain-containing protein [Reichenbachiella agariperforans]SHK52060.1 hypothetical protein SAMN04488028_105290 [Reichenbachiella agariperforans]